MTQEITLAGKPSFSSLTNAVAELVPAVSTSIDVGIVRSCYHFRPQ